MFSNWPRNLMLTKSHVFHLKKISDAMALARYKIIKNERIRIPMTWMYTITCERGWSGDRKVHRTQFCKESTTTGFFLLKILFYLVVKIKLSKFRNLKEKECLILVNNFRPIQPLKRGIITFRSHIGCNISRDWSLLVILSTYHHRCLSLLQMNCDCLNWRLKTYLIG